MQHEGWLSEHNSTARRANPQAVGRNGTAPRNTLDNSTLCKTKQVTDIFCNKTKQHLPNWCACHGVSQRGKTACTLFQIATSVYENYLWWDKAKQQEVYTEISEYTLTIHKCPVHKLGLHGPAPSPQTLRVFC